MGGVDFVCVCVIIFFCDVFRLLHGEIPGGSWSIFSLIRSSLEGAKDFETSSALKIPPAAECIGQGAVMAYI